MCRAYLLAAAFAIGIAIPDEALATQYDLYQTSWTPWGAWIALSAGPTTIGSRDVLIRADANLDVSRIGARMHMQGASEPIRFEIRASDSGGSNGTVLGTNTTTLSGTSATTYTVPMSVSMVAGSYYLLRVHSTVTVRPTIEGYQESGSNLPYSVGGGVTVLDGGANVNLGNIIIPAFVLDFTVTCTDTDGDGQQAASCGGTDCDDSAATTFLGATELCDGIDNNCDAVVPANESDADGDGQRTCGGDCDDADSANFTGNPELCDDADNDCDGTADDGLAISTYYADADNDGYGDPASSLTDCAAPAGHVADNTDCNDTTSAISPGAAELCNGSDDNCNAQIDDGAPDDDGDGVCDAYDLCDGDDASGDLDNDGTCNDLDPDSPQNVPFLPWWALLALGGGLAGTGGRMAKEG